MKKVIAIFLVFVYTSSFAGIFASAECTRHTNTEISSEATHHHGIAGKLETGGKQHPLLQFCKVVDFHKEVLPGAKAKANRAVVTLLANGLSYEILPLGNTGLLFTGHCDALPQKLFIVNRELLI